MRHGIGNLVRLVEHEAQPSCRQFDEPQEIAFQLAEHGGRYYQECTGGDILKIGMATQQSVWLAVVSQERLPCHIRGDCRSKHNDIADLVEFQQVLRPLVDRRRLSGSLLPVEQGVPFLQHEVQIMLLQVGELADLHVLVHECCPVKISGQFRNRFHTAECPALKIVSVPLSAYQP